MMKPFQFFAVFFALVLTSCAKNESHDILSEARTEIVALQASLSELSSQISALEGRKADSDTANDLDETLASLASAVSALQLRIEAESAAMRDSKTATADIMARIEVLGNEVAWLRSSFDAASASLEPLLSFVKGIAFVPKSTEHCAVIENPSSLTLDYELSPRRCARSIADRWSDTSTALQVNCRRVSVRSSASASVYSLPVTSVAFADADSLLRVTVDVSELVDDFWSFNDALTLNLTIFDGNRPVISSPFSDIVFAYQPLPPSGLPLVLSDTARFSVVCPPESSRAARNVALKINAELRRYSNFSQGVLASSAGEDAWEIIIGEAPYQPADSLYRQLTYGSYLFCRFDRKILVSAAPEDVNAYRIAEDFFSKYINYNYDARRKAVVLHDGVLPEGIQSSVGVKGYVPPFITDKSPDHIFQTGYKSNDDAAMQVDFSGCGIDDFDSYCSSLEGAGYDRLCDNAFGTCHYATWSDGKYQVSVSFYGDTGLFRVVSEPAYAKPIWSIEGTAGNVQPLMYQCYQDGIKVTGTFNSYIMRLPDGRFLINDMGGDADQIMDYMRSRNVFTDGKVHIALIIITHPHGDHFTELPILADRYASEIVCDAVAFNLTHHTRESVYGSSTLYGRLNVFVNSATKLGAQCYCLRAGQKLNLGGATLEVLFTPDELGDFFLDGNGTNRDQNNSNNITRLTVDGQQITFPGDCRGGEAEIFNQILLGSFTSDIMTVCHHGFCTTTNSAMYGKACPVVLFWPVTTAQQDMTRAFDRYLMSATWVKKHFFEDEPVEIELPYWPE